MGQGAPQPAGVAGIDAEGGGCGWAEQREGLDERARPTKQTGPRTLARAPWGLIGCANEEMPQL
jgi:hypothetical protein